MASISNYREVPLEVYVNGELFLIDSVWIPDEENLQVDFMVTDSIYDLLGCLPGDITAQLEVDDDECMSVSHAALEGEDLQIDIICNSTETTTEWIGRKVSGFLRTLFWMNPAPEPEVTLVTVRWPAEVPENKNYSPKRVIKKMSACLQKYFPIDPAEPLSDPVTEPELDLPEPKESCVPDANVPDTEPVSSEDRKVDVSDGVNASPEMSRPGESTEGKKIRAFFKKYFPLDAPDTEPVSGWKVDVSDASPEINGPEESTEGKKMSAFFKKYFPLDAPDTEPVSAEDQKVDVSDDMNASPEMSGPGESTEGKKIRAFFKKYFPLDAADTEPVSAEDQKVDVSDGVNAPPEMSGPGESTKKKKIRAFFKKYFPLDAPDTEPVSGWKVDVSDASPEINGPEETTTEWMAKKINEFFQMLFGLDPAVPEPTAEMDLVSVGWQGSSSGIEKYSPKTESTKKKKIRAFFKKYFPLDAPDTEPVSGWKVDVSDASPEINGPEESTKDTKMSAFFKKYFPLDLAELD
ncbi:neuroblast differentiation-associated protein AHNAK-like [Pseudorasbora parva]|uniref:neuroblast differentiation-associated protein AHNAK-like n=1 Tax=Pseudorasbora parva TaxID=51549 RepID=UPI00351EA21B